jgi:hypothetical protein
MLFSFFFFTCRLALYRTPTIHLIYSNIIHHAEPYGLFIEEKCTHGDCSENVTQWLQNVMCGM